MKELKTILSEMANEVRNNNYPTDKYSELYFKAKQKVATLNAEERNVLKNVLSGDYRATDLEMSGKKYMKRDEILETIRSLAQSQGFYGRVLSRITDETLDELEKQGFADSVDLVLFFES